MKIQELEDRKKIQHLLSLTHPTETEITYFIKDHPSNIVHRSKHNNNSNNNTNKNNKKKGSAREESPVVGHRDRLKYNEKMAVPPRRTNATKQQQVT